MHRLIFGCERWVCIKHVFRACFLAKKEASSSKGRNGYGKGKKWNRNLFLGYDWVCLGMCVKTEVGKKKEGERGEEEASWSKVEQAGATEQWGIIV